MKAMLDDMMQNYETQNQRMKKGAHASEQPMTVHLQCIQMSGVTPNTMHKTLMIDTWWAFNWMYQLLIVIWIILDVQILNFLDWLQSMDMYFVWYLFSEAESHVRYHVIDWTS